MREKSAFFGGTRKTQNMEILLSSEVCLAEVADQTSFGAHNLPVCVILSGSTDKHKCTHMEDRWLGSSKFPQSIMTEGRGGRE